jgi:DegV family protein with EDD domain
MKPAIVADSLACLPKEIVEKYNIEVVPANLLFGGKIYKDGLNLTAEQAYSFIEKSPETFSTSAPSPGDFLITLRKLINNGRKEILYIGLSSKLSATWNSARIAKEQIKSDFPEVKIEVIDSTFAGPGEAILISRAIQEIERGKSLSEIANLVDSLKRKVEVLLVLETIRYLYRSGRFPESATKIASLLPVKPILKFSEGKLALFGISNSKESCLEKILNFLKADWDQKTSEIWLTHADCENEVKSFKEKILKIYPSTKIFVTEFSPIIGYVTGRGTLGIGFFGK